MPGFISFLSALLLSITVTLTVVYWQEKKRRLMIIFGFISLGFAVVAVVAGAIYYLAPTPPPIQQTVGPPEKPYLFIKDSRFEELTAGKSPVVVLDVLNGPIESTLVFRNITCTFTRLIPEKYLKYTRNPHTQKNTFSPRQGLEMKWFLNDLVLTQDQIDELNTAPPSAELYAFAEAEYSDEAGKHPFNACFRYETQFPPNHLVFCTDDIKIE